MQIRSWRSGVLFVVLCCVVGLLIGAMAGQVDAAPAPGWHDRAPEMQERPSKGPLTCGNSVGDTGFEPVTSSV